MEFDWDKEKKHLNSEQLDDLIYTITLLQRASSKMGYWVFDFIEWCDKNVEPWVDGEQFDIVKHIYKNAHGYHTSPLEMSADEIIEQVGIPEGPYDFEDYKVPPRNIGMSLALTVNYITESDSIDDVIKTTRDMILSWFMQYLLNQKSKYYVEATYIHVQDWRANRIM